MANGIGSSLLSEVRGDASQTCFSLAKVALAPFMADLFCGLIGVVIWMSLSGALWFGYWEDMEDICHRRGCGLWVMLTGQISPDGKREADVHLGTLRNFSSPSSSARPLSISSAFSSGPLSPSAGWAPWTHRWARLHPFVGFLTAAHALQGETCSAEEGCWRNHFRQQRVY